ncbi:hypothetical protein DRE_01008 [Drechslerella stenobrocha 248]|uniref:N-acetyltransferase domain-containing protein n=1 Tax=Drechslerella stenobrocha 248 TaxID=1043628 RepID=W7HP60_9PEZI|nr:hypothetical protein DRE_01008 [Drechslerella stenobrocha 248]
MSHPGQPPPSPPDADAPQHVLTFTVSPALESDLPDTIDLFTRYANSLHIDLAFQAFAEELAGLPGRYAPPTGQILLARRVTTAPPPPPSELVQGTDSAAAAVVAALTPLPARAGARGWADASANTDESAISSRSGDMSRTSDGSGEAVGCVAVRGITLATGYGSAGVRRCEMKRLYTVPSTRGRGVGRELVARALEVAREIGYEEMYLDTLPSMTAALEMYERFGFERTEAYYHNPHEGVVFLVKRL